MKAALPSPESYAHAAWMLDCDAAAIQAVAEVEAGPAGAWIEIDGKQVPQILYEPHLFHEMTGGRFDARYPDLSYPKWNPKGYGTRAEQHAKLDRAVKLDRDSALRATSWGLFQILGINHRRAGHTFLQAFVNAAYSDVDAHLRMFVNFVNSKYELVEAIRTHDWKTFARLYNGPRYAENKYDTKMAAAYARLSA